MSVRVRFAPSPTGHLHIGSARSALFNWLFARHHNGVFLLRIEDTDVARSTDEYTQSVLESLAWLGMTSNEPIVYQSRSLERYREAAEQLLASDHAYRCYCTPEELEQRLPNSPYGKKYDGHCRAIAQQLDKPYVLRFKIPERVGDIAFTDEILGQIVVPADQLDDFVIVRSDGMPMYNFAVVVDDAFMRITHVIRGQEHIANTPKQLLLYKALNLVAPHFAHLTVILNKEGGKLSKRDGAVSLIEYKQQGFLVDGLINFLARLGWSHGNQELFSVDELIKHFDLKHVGKSNAVFDMEKLLWVNGEHIKRCTSAQLYVLLQRDVDQTLDKQLGAWSVAQREAAIGLYKTRVTTLCALRDEIVGLLKRPDQYEHVDLATVTGDVRSVLVAIHSDLVMLQEWAAPGLEGVIKRHLQQSGVSIAPVAHALRVALTGKSAGAGIFQMLAVIGKEESILRIEALLRALK